MSWLPLLGWQDNGHGCFSSSTFTHNMLAFGLNKKLCSDFLKKQAVIGNLDEEQYKLLSDHIEQMATE